MIVLLLLLLLLTNRLVLLLLSFSPGFSYGFPVILFAGHISSECRSPGCGRHRCSRPLGTLATWSASMLGANRYPLVSIQKAMAT